jgi:hypothetical protein
MSSDNLSFGAAVCSFLSVVLAALLITGVSIASKTILIAEYIVFAAASILAVHFIGFGIPKWFEFTYTKRFPKYLDYTCDTLPFIGYPIVRPGIATRNRHTFTPFRLGDAFDLTAPCPHPKGRPDGPTRATRLRIDWHARGELVIAPPVAITFSSSLVRYLNCPKTSRQD